MAVVCPHGDGMCCDWIYRRRVDGLMEKKRGVESLSMSEAQKWPLMI